MDTTLFPLPTPLPSRQSPAGDCMSCVMARLCRAPSEEACLAPAARSRRSVRRGEALYRAGDALHNLYLLRAGSMKIRVTNTSGLEQITAFPVAGSLLGLDAIETGIHTCDAIALEDSVTCALPYRELEANCERDADVGRQFHRLIAHDMNQCQRLLLTLGRMTTDERLASFLVDTSEQMAAHGYSPRKFVLKMTREDIANHLGMKIETVCRVFSRLQSASLLHVSKRHLEILDVEALRRMSCG
ncbi:helix-turn-helix domain-containing protein [Achromobacter pulmonis]|uniref:Fumarate and nitrate reduction regulatory protein n=1 Tax=Achromobacter pulmonis TaxID=1389932 RepID=A0A6S7DHQ8_9BURK|nr:helix-turn-helix domain-containing protein [Achromobacter pulmonis]CAB3825871.1 Fumarate and nitrate reduction regulatory protein [Achromobacter pulmonis]